MRVMSARVRSSNAAAVASSAEQQAESLRAFLQTALAGHERISVPRHPTLASPQGPPPGMARRGPSTVHASAAPAGDTHRLHPRQGRASSASSQVQSDEGGVTRPDSPPDPSAFLDEAAELITLHGVGTHRRQNKQRAPMGHEGEHGTTRRCEVERRRARGREQVAARKRQRQTEAKQAAAAQAAAEHRRQQAMASLQASQRRAVGGRKPAVPAQGHSRRTAPGATATATAIKHSKVEPTTAYGPTHGPGASQDDLYMQWMGAQAAEVRGPSPSKRPPVDERSGSPSAFMSPGAHGYTFSAAGLPSSSELQRSFRHPRGSPSPEQRGGQTSSEGGSSTKATQLHVPQLPLGALVREANTGHPAPDPSSSLTTGGGWRVPSPSTTSDGSGSLDLPDGLMGGAHTTGSGGAYGPTSARTAASLPPHSSRSGTPPISSGRGGGRTSSWVQPGADEEAAAPNGSSPHGEQGEGGFDLSPRTPHSANSTRESKGSLSPPEAAMQGRTGGFQDDMQHSIRKLQAQVKALAAERKSVGHYGTPTQSPRTPPSNSSKSDAVIAMEGFMARLASAAHTLEAEGGGGLTAAPGPPLHPPLGPGSTASGGSSAPSERFMIAQSALLLAARGVHGASIAGGDQLSSLMALDLGGDSDGYAGGAHILSDPPSGVHSVSNIADTPLGDRFQSSLRREVAPPSPSGSANSSGSSGLDSADLQYAASLAKRSLGRRHWQQAAEHTVNNGVVEVSPARGSRGEGGGVSPVSPPPTGFSMTELLGDELEQWAHEHEVEHNPDYVEPHTSKYSDEELQEQVQQVERDAQSAAAAAAAGGAAGADRVEKLAHAHRAARRFMEERAQQQGGSAVSSDPAQAKIAATLAALPTAAARAYFERVMGERSGLGLPAPASDNDAVFHPEPEHLQRVSAQGGATRRDEGGVVANWVAEYQSLGIADPKRRAKWLGDRRGYEGGGMSEPDSPPRPSAAALHQQVLEGLTALDALAATEDSLAQMQRNREAAAAEAELVAMREAWSQQATAAAAAAHAATLEVTTQAALEARTAAMGAEYEAAYAERMSELAALAEEGQLALKAARQVEGGAQTSPPPSARSVGVEADEAEHNAEYAARTLLNRAAAAGLQWPPHTMEAGTQAASGVEIAVGGAGGVDSGTSPLNFVSQKTPSGVHPLRLQADAEGVGGVPAPPLIPFEDGSLSPGGIESAYATHAAALGTALAAYQRDPRSCTPAQVALLRQASKGVLPGAGGGAFKTAVPHLPSLEGVQGASRAPPVHPHTRADTIVPPPRLGRMGGSARSSIASSYASGYSSDAFEEDEYTAEFDESGHSAHDATSISEAYSEFGGGAQGEQSVSAARPMVGVVGQVSDEESLEIVSEAASSVADEAGSGAGTASHGGRSVQSDSHSLEVEDESVASDHGIVAEVSELQGHDSSAHALTVSFAPSPDAHRGGGSMGPRGAPGFANLVSPDTAASSYTYLSENDSPDSPPAEEVFEGGEGGLSSGRSLQLARAASFASTAYSVDDFEPEREDAQTRHPVRERAIVASSAGLSASRQSNAARNTSASLDFSLLDAMVSNGEAPLHLVNTFKSSLEARVEGQMRVLDASEMGVAARRTSDVQGGTPEFVAAMRFETEVAGIVRARADVRVQAYRDMVLFRSQVTGDSSLLNMPVFHHTMQQQQSMYAPLAQGPQLALQDRTPPSQNTQQYHAALPTSAPPSGARPPRSAVGPLAAGRPSRESSPDASGAYTDSFVSDAVSEYEANAVADTVDDFAGSVSEDGSSLEIEEELSERGSSEHDGGLPYESLPPVVAPSVPFDATYGSDVFDSFGDEEGGTASRVTATATSMASDGYSDAFVDEASPDTSAQVAPAVPAAASVASVQTDESLEIGSSVPDETSKHGASPSGTVQAEQSAGSAGGYTDESFVSAAPSVESALAPPTESLQESLPQEAQADAQRGNTTLNLSVSDSGVITAAAPAGVEPPSTTLGSGRQPGSSLGLSLTQSSSYLELSQSAAAQADVVTALRVDVAAQRKALRSVRRRIASTENKVLLKQEAEQLQAELEQLTYALSSETQELAALQRVLLDTPAEEHGTPEAFPGESIPPSPRSEGGSGAAVHASNTPGGRVHSGDDDSSDAYSSDAFTDEEEHAEEEHGTANNDLDSIPSELPDEVSDGEHSSDGEGEGGGLSISLGGGPPGSPAAERIVESTKLQSPAPSPLVVQAHSPGGAGEGGAGGSPSPPSANSEGGSQYSDDSFAADAHSHGSQQEHADDSRIADHEGDRDGYSTPPTMAQPTSGMEASPGSGLSPVSVGRGGTNDPPLHMPQPPLELMGQVASPHSASPCQDGGGAGGFEGGSSVEDLTESQDRIVLTPSPLHPVSVEPVQGGVTIVAPNSSGLGQVAPGTVLASSSNALYLTEAHFPPRIFVPEADVMGGLLTSEAGEGGYNPYLGQSVSYSVGGVSGAAMALSQPHTPVAALIGYVNFNEDLVEVQVADADADTDQDATPAASPVHTAMASEVPPGDISDGSISDDIPDAAASSDSDKPFLAPQAVVTTTAASQVAPASPDGSAYDSAEPPAADGAASPDDPPLATGGAPPLTPGAACDPAPLLQALIDEAISDALQVKRLKQNTYLTQLAQKAHPVTEPVTPPGSHSPHPVGHRAAQPAMDAHYRSDSFSDDDSDVNAEQLNEEHHAGFSPIVANAAAETSLGDASDSGSLSPPLPTEERGGVAIDPDTVLGAFWKDLLHGTWASAEQAYSTKRHVEVPRSPPRPTVITSSPVLGGREGGVGGSLPSPSQTSPVELDAGGFGSPTSTPPPSGYGGGGSSPRGSDVETFVTTALAAAARKSPVAAMVSGGLSPASPDLHGLGGSHGGSPLSAPSREDSEPDLYADESFELDSSLGDGDDDAWYNFEGMADSLGGAGGSALGNTFKKTGNAASPPSTPPGVSLGGFPALAGQSVPGEDTRPGSRNGEGDSAEHNVFVQVARSRDELKHAWVQDCTEFCAEVWAHIDEHAALAKAAGSASGRSGGASLSHSSGSGLTLPMRLSVARWAHLVLSVPPSGVPITDEQAEIAATGPVPVDLFVLLEQARSHVPQRGIPRLSASQLERVQVRHKLMFDFLNEAWAAPKEVAALRKHLNRARAAREDMLQGAPGPNDAAEVLVYLSASRAQSVSRVKRMAAALTLPAPRDAASDDALAAYAKHGWVGPPLFGEHALTRASAVGRKSARLADAPLRMAGEEVNAQQEQVAAEVADSIFQDLLAEMAEDVLAMQELK